MEKTYIVTNIKYDTDGVKIKLPKELTVIVPEDITDEDDIVEFISEDISKQTGFCHEGFNMSLK